VVGRCTVALISGEETRCALFSCRHNFADGVRPSASAPLTDSDTTAGRVCGVAKCAAVSRNGASLATGVTRSDPSVVKAMGAVVRGSSPARASWCARGAALRGCVGALFLLRLSSP
jgi:hypothetical protein